jgi:hypothetical protein
MQGPSVIRLALPSGGAADEIHGQWSAVEKAAHADVQE